MKSLEKDRNRRYETASALAADVERYLREEPVQAGKPTGRLSAEQVLEAQQETGGCRGNRSFGPARRHRGHDMGIDSGRPRTTGEAKSRERADRQSELALNTLRLVVDDIQSKLNNVAGAMKYGRAY